MIVQPYLSNEKCLQSSVILCFHFKLSFTLGEKRRALCRINYYVLVILLAVLFDSGYSRLMILD
jgi:hypothetical protein